MSHWLLLLAFVAARASARSADDPREVVRAAGQATEAGDVSANALAARWRARVAGRADDRADDRAAWLGLATLARLRTDYPAAESAYSRLTGGSPDRYAAYAQLGLGEGYDVRGYWMSAGPAFERALRTARDVGDRVGEGEALLMLAFVRGRMHGVRVA